MAIGRTTQIIIGSIAVTSLAIVVLSTTTAPAITPAITRISLESRCFGCDGYRIEFGSDGSATKIAFGSLRHGTTQQILRSRITPSDFETLADAIAQSGFFDLQESYGAQGDDGRWTITTVVRGDMTKAVLDRNLAAPEALHRMEEMIDRLAERVDWERTSQ